MLRAATKVGPVFCTAVGVVCGATSTPKDTERVGTCARLATLENRITQVERTLAVPPRRANAALLAQDGAWTPMWTSAADANHASSVLARTQCKAAPLTLLRDLRSPPLPWASLVDDSARRSFALLLRRADSGLEEATLRHWFNALHPAAFAGVDGTWTGSQHQGKELLRKTAWAAFLPDCECEYGYADTWQQRATHAEFRALLESIANHIEALVGLPEGSFNSVNLNW